MPSSGRRKKEVRPSVSQFSVTVTNIGDKSIYKEKRLKSGVVVQAL
jgi:hypothetical protein